MPSFQRTKTSIRRLVARGLLPALFLTLPAILPAQQAAIGEYSVPTARSYPWGITAGPDGALWFTEFRTSKIGRITIAGVIREYAAGSGSEGITTGPDGALWFAETDGNIGRMTPAGELHEYPVPSGPVAITTGPDGALWFTAYDSRGSNIGRITTAGVVTMYPLPDGSGPSGITAGPDGALWFAEQYGYIGRITTAGAITEYAVPTFLSSPHGITTGPDGALWFTEFGANIIGCITTAGVITEYPVPAGGGWRITTGPDGALWYTGSEIGAFTMGAIGRITTAGVATAFLAPTADSVPLDITAGPHGSLWFTEQLGNAIGEVVITNANLGVTPDGGFFGTILTFAGSTFVPNETVNIYDRGIGSGLLATAVADAGGSFTANTTEPQSPYGRPLFVAIGQSSGKIGAAEFSVAPRLILSPSSGSAGATVVAEGTGFGAGEQVVIYWSNPRTTLGTATANQSGTIKGTSALTFTIPPGAPAGPNLVIGHGQTTQAAGHGYVTVE